MYLFCSCCGKEFYLSEQDPIPDLADLSCDQCNGQLIYQDDLEDFDEDELHIPMSL